MTTGEMAKAPALFLRNATGLVKGWSGFDAFAYSFMSVNLVALGMFYSLAIFGYVPDGSAVLSIVITAIGMTFMSIAYAGLIAAMPRAGGDYVWQTRVLDGIPGAVVGGAFGAIALFLTGTALGLDTGVTYGAMLLGVIVGAALGLKRGGIGFVLSATGWWFILALWAPIYGFIFKIEFVQPLAAVLGWKAGVDFFGTADGTFVVSIFTIVVTSALVALGMAGYARIQRWCLYIGLAALAVMFILLLVSSVETFKAAYDREGQALFGVSNAYQATIDQGTAQGVNGGDAGNFSLGGATFALVPFMLFFLLYPNWGSTLYGEVRGAGDFRKVMNGMLGGLWATAGLAVVFVFLAAKAFGWEFFNASNGTYVNWAYGYVDYVKDAPVVPIWGFPGLLAAYLIDSHIVQAIIVIAFGAWWLGWTGTLFLSSTRMIFAAAFDRVLPEWAARVSDRGVPWGALALIMVPSVVLSWLYSYQAGTFYPLTLDATLVIAVTFLGSSIAATILPYWKPDIYNASPVAKYKIAGLPVISIAGLLSTLFLGWVLYLWLSDALYGIGVGNTNSIVFLGVLYGAAAVLYVVARFWRRAQGVDLDAIHAQIPAE